MRKPAAGYKALVIILAAAALAAWPPCTAAGRLPPRREMLFFLNPEWGLCWRHTLRSHDCAVDTFTSFFAFRPLRLSTGCCSALRGIIDNNCILSWLNPLLPLLDARCRSTRGGVGHDVAKEESPVGALHRSAPVVTGSPIPGPVGGSVSSSASVGEPPNPEEAKGGKVVQGNEPAAAPAVPPAVDQGTGPSTSSFSTPAGARGIEPVASPGVAPSSSHAVAPISPHGEEEPFSNGDRGIEPSPSPSTSSHVAAPSRSQREEEEPFSNGGDRGIEPSPPPLEPIHTGNVIAPSPTPSSATNSNGTDDGIVGPSSQQGDLLSSSARAPSSSSGAQEPFHNGDQGIEPSLSPLEVGLAPRSSTAPEPISNAGFEPSPSPSEQINTRLGRNERSVRNTE